MILTSAWCSHFAVLINDVFLLRWQAEHLSFATPESFYNGFFPIGYPLVLRVASLIGNPIFAMILFQIGLAPLYAMLVYRLLARLALGRAINVALPLVLFAPPVIHAIPSATPDFFVGLLVLISCVLLLREGRWNFVLAGVCVGASCLFRSHLLALFLTLLLSLLIFQKNSRWSTFTQFCAGAIPLIAAQGILQIWSGHGFFENAQAFNIWKSMHGMDWSNPPALAHAKALGVIMENPALFASSVGNWLLLYSLYLIPLVGIIILAFVRSRSGAIGMSRALVSLAFAALAYLVVAAAGGSVSAFIPVLPIAAACTIPLIELILSHRSLKFREYTISILTTIIWITGLTWLFIFTMREANRVEDYAKIEQLLGVHSRSDALTIYTDDYDFYFPGLTYQTPRHTGGWGEVGLPNFLTEFPHIHNSSAEIERGDLINNGIEWVIYRIPPYDPMGYETVKNDRIHFRPIYRTSYHEIYRIQ